MNEGHGEMDEQEWTNIQVGSFMKHERPQNCQLASVLHTIPSICTRLPKMLNVIERKIP